MVKGLWAKFNKVSECQGKILGFSRRATCSGTACSSETLQQESPPAPATVEEDKASPWYGRKKHSGDKPCIPQDLWQGEDVPLYELYQGRLNERAVKEEEIRAVLLKREGLEGV